ncbi:hypothetical protein [Streptomyces goshikiensis]|uniref:hypothetical protein n=1 Tax=Streptomyces goshikiensis TaxID=1942 RepID=UPI00365BE6FD
MPSAYAAPHGTVQRHLRTMWQEVLGIEQIDVDETASSTSAVRGSPARVFEQA